MMFVGWIAFSLLVGFIATSRGRSGFGWCLLALAITPIVAGVVVLVLPPRHAALEADQVASGTARKCPACAEVIRPEAIKCRFCGADLPAERPLTADEKAQRLYGG